MMTIATIILITTIVSILITMLYLFMCSAGLNTLKASDPLINFKSQKVLNSEPQIQLFKAIGYVELSPNSIVYLHLYSDDTLTLLNHIDKNIINVLLVNGAPYKIIKYDRDVNENVCYPMRLCMVKEFKVNSDNFTILHLEKLTTELGLGVQDIDQQYFEFHLGGLYLPIS